MSKRRILYVEDNNDNFRLVERILSRMNLEVERADTAVAAIEMTQKNRYDLVLTDILLPDNTIHEVQRNLLLPVRQQIGPHTPLVALTAHAFSFDKEFLLASGCDHFVAKPLNINEFQSLVTSLLHLD